MRRGGDRDRQAQGAIITEGADALDHVAAVSLSNEGTIRDWVRHAKFNVTQGQEFRCFRRDGPLADPVSRPSDQTADIALATRVNGEGPPKATGTGRMTLFPSPDHPALIVPLDLQAGEPPPCVPGRSSILTGTPTGAGARLEFPPVLAEAPADVVEGFLFFFPRGGGGSEADGIGPSSQSRSVDEEPA